jgi:hypothetical protein
MTATAFKAGDCGERMLAPAAARSDLLPSLRGMFNALAGAPTLHAAQEAIQARPSQSRDDQGSDDQGSGAAQHPSFAPLDPNILNESIVAFFIGRNADGLWVAREGRGRIGGIFLLKSSALSFARRHAGDAACATIFPAESIELDIANDGNRLIGVMWPVMRGVTQLCRRLSQRMNVS